MTTGLEIKNSAVVVVFIIIKYSGLYGRLTDSNYFYTEESMPCRNFRVRLTPFACTVVTVNVICEWPVGSNINDWCNNSN